MSKKGVYGDASGSDLDHRRKWNSEHYERKAKEREEILDEREKEAERKRSGSKKNNPAYVKPEIKFITAREDILELDANLNKTIVVSATSGKQPGYYCEACDCVLKDSVNYLDHMNGQKHLLNMGVTMKTIRSSVSDVKSRLEKLKRRNDDPEDIDIEARLERARRANREEEEQKKNKKKEKKRAKHEEHLKKKEESEDMNVASLMGFGGFGSTGVGKK
ncbi:zinc finger, matrin-type 2 [Nowakowskiella sp. JEL0078]|nr:zinc finger, matrin-type 2 [Nowakowskiella sp. JEL0078]